MYIARLNGPECCKNFLPYCVASGKSLKLLCPGVTPLIPGNSLVIDFTWSVTCPSVNDEIFSFKVFPSKLLGNS